MSFAAAQSIAEAVLYEGYLLYPYRASSVKNRRRWTFGGVYPEAHCAAQKGSDASFMQTECLVSDSDDAAIEVSVRFLHLVETTDVEAPPGAESWQEAEPRDVVVPELLVRDLLLAPREITFCFARLREGTRGRTRRREAVRGVVRVSASRVGTATVKLTVRIENRTNLAHELVGVRDEALLRALVSTHTVLTVARGEFVSMFDPPEALRDAAAGCKSVGTWPVLVGEEGQRDGVLSSPVILYDYPRIAKESPGDLFDGTEIDEILTLRILTLTDDEKREVRALGGRPRALLDRTEALDAAALARLHGAMQRDEPRGARSAEPSPWGNVDGEKPARATVGGVPLGAGDRVRLVPRGRADVMDIVLAGKLATIATVEQDFEGRVHFAVTIDDDPGRDLGLLGQPGHRFFFAPEDVEPVPREAPPPIREAIARDAGPPRILVAGVGNIFLGDDGFGSELARRLAARSWPEGVKVVDFGIRGMDLTFTLLDGYDAAILLDVVRRGGAPGTLYVIEPETRSDDTSNHLGADMHGMHPARVLDLVRGMGGKVATIRLVGCEPETFGDVEEMAMGLSAPLLAALEPAAEMVASLVLDLRREHRHA